VNEETAMRAAFREPVKDARTRLGVASWDDGSGTKKSVKYTWFDKNGKAARGGELPVEALPQALDFAIRKGYINATARKGRHGETESQSKKLEQRHPFRCESVVKIRTRAC
jgi:hypothetical protein